jgi:hypothetical protein
MPPGPKFAPGSDLVFGSVAALRELEIRRSIPALARLATKPNPGVITRNELRAGGTRLSAVRRSRVGFAA